MSAAFATDPYVLGDWGTSRLRLYLDEGGEITRHSEGPGVGTLASATAAARAETLNGLVAAWAAPDASLEVFLCGMAGSPAGLVEVPYASLPADVANWSRKARSTRTGRLDVTIAAGLCTAGPDLPPDVMRGEETQVFGAMELDPALAAGRQLFLLPGTHSKWVEAHDGAATRFRTAMTGEMYALLREHSTLLDGSGEATTRRGEADRKAGMAAGVERSATLDGGLLAVLFETRAGRLLDGRSPAWATGFLSGLLIGYEIMSMATHFESPGCIHLVGDPELVSIYRFVFMLRGDPIETLDGADCAIAGLRLLRRLRAEDGHDARR